ncbi:putative B3 DNA binding domain, DNA-binding pseudobarrel domain superfamily [Helianthus annuus]|uniref:B3 DNA binding domain, DNA-binding pseudobarrel domain superfamily n=1 Tax=Helianthus annuus TaxID=4232 RepID=A0A251U480_HELAN|nr:putative B3 domain-containing protein At3g49610 [Helianthus annuus]KAF5794426.1 putative B3 DNA binding domain, DNA-binding pseudobarrel domain superfamily [Helianthus annuus]KAJ0538103.1 putative B3 DNA binding domain, DNA-binding pseudobarrel domain superfamily [Helianthus annuus]KAJ0545837.1 putative B3 DNA binding domain, DNA-binding pseudobarrel domain superfamily [Helianthus annuus]KAJ0552701.1 putative B3 DNA binding domain, DNA-binding pseudobarrel domain superfamily [Helianthus annu
MAEATETDFLKQQKGRRRIKNFLAAINYHDDDLQTTIKIMRMKLLEIQQRDSSAVINKPQTVRKIIFKFSGSKTVLHKHDDIEKDSRNMSHSETKRQKINNGGMQFVMDFIKSVGGSEAQFVIEKRLTISDVNPNQGRLLIPVLQLKNKKGFLTADEETMMGNKEDVSVWVFDPERRKSMLNLAKWKMSKECYVLKTNWNQVVKANGFKEEIVIRVLSFRVDDQLCFVLDRVA